MGFLAQRFPGGARGAAGGPSYSVTLAALPSGKEQRNLNRTYPRQMLTVTQGLRVDEDWREGDAFFRKARGKTHTFRVQDGADYQLAVADSALVQITTTTFQLAKLYGTDEPTFQETRRLTRIVAGTLQVFLDAVLQATPANYTVNIDTGIVTFAVAPGAAVRTASCEFDVPCRFDFDEKNHEVFLRRQNGQVFLRWENIRLLEDMDG
jgi:uncharacterized protein (TIGR02217 family)